ncbi:MAG: TSUP family transporter [bacterium]
MQYLIICTAAFVTSGLTLFSGFGLGMLLMPVFAVFFPVDVAVAMTAVVHLLNNLLKLTIFGKHCDRSVLVRFAFPAIFAAFGGAFVLTWFSQFEPLIVYHVGSAEAEVLPIKMLIAVLMVIFSLFEIHPGLQQFEFGKRYLFVGGALSGFFGGLSGHQGALRSAFLARAGLTKEAFIGTGVLIACLVDVTRISVYGAHYALTGALQNVQLLTAATLAAFFGVFVGGRFVKVVTMKTIQRLVSGMLFLLALGLASGFV